MSRIKLLVSLVIMSGIILLVGEQFNRSDACCPRMMQRLRQSLGQGESADPKDDKKEDKKQESSSEEKKVEEKQEEKKSGESSGSGSDNAGDASGGGSPAPAPQRPPLGPGIQPLIQSMKSGGSSLIGAVEPWEAWWTRNRDSFLNVHIPNEWVKVQATDGGTQSVTRFEVYDKLIGILSAVLADSDQFLSFRAAISLGMAKDPVATAALKKAYPDEKKFFLRNNIVFAMGLSGDASCLDTVKEVLTTKTEAVLSRCYAAAALGYINDPASVKALQEVAGQKEDAELTCCALLSLGNLGDASSIPLLSGLLNPKDKSARKDARIKVHAALALARIGTGQITPEQRKVILAELAKAAPERERDTRAAVAIALGMLKAAESKDLLLNMLNSDGSRLVRGLAAVALAQSNVKNITEPISTAFQKSGEEEKGLMMIALALAGDVKSKTKFSEVIQGRKDRVLTKGAAAIALGILKDKDAVPLLAETLKKQNDPNLRPYVVLALGMIGDEKAVEPLAKEWAVADSESGQKNLDALAYTNLAVALTMLGKRDDLVLPQLVKHCSKDAPEKVRIYALHTLGIVGNRDSVKAFVDAYEGEKTPSNLCKSLVTGIGFAIDKNSMPIINRFTANNHFDIYMIIMDHLLPIPVW
ncbi:MAG: HEAT repeat domain-containing protein [Candidatus Brocadiia bacterium]